MAEGRMLKRNISRSEKLARLKSDKPRVLYFMMLPYLDVEGRLEANPKLIRGQIIPLLNYSVAKVQQCLEELDEVGLIQLYEGNGKKCLEYFKFNDHQNLRKDREAASEHPTPPQRQADARHTPIEVNLKEVKLSKGKFKPPTIEEVIEYVKEKGYQVDVKKFMEYYTESGWLDRDGKPFRSWKQKIIAVWNKPGGRKLCRFSGCKGYGVYTSTDDTGQVCWWCEDHKPRRKLRLPTEMAGNLLKSVPDKDKRSTSDKRNEQKNKLGVR